MDRSSQALAAGQPLQLPPSMETTACPRRLSTVQGCSKQRDFTLHSLGLSQTVRIAWHNY